METSDAYHQLRAEIQRMLDGTAQPAALQGWCLQHVPSSEPASDEQTVRLWQHTLRSLVVYAQCSLDRWMLESSLRLLLTSFEKSGHACLTPITMTPCYRALRDQGQRHYAPLRTDPLPIPAGRAADCRRGECSGDRHD